MKAKRVKKLKPARGLDENAARIVRVRLAELRSFSSEAHQTASSEAQHDMRIAAKRLRYVLEATELCFGKPAETARRRAKDLQTVLGELHDCDEMLPRVQRHLSSLRSEDADAIRARALDGPDLAPGLAAAAPHRTSYRGLAVLSVYLEARRRLLHDRFTGLWAELERRGTWDELDRAATRVLRKAKRRRKRGTASAAPLRLSRFTPP